MTRHDKRESVMKIHCMSDTSFIIRLVPLLVMAAIFPQRSMASVTFANAEATVMLGVQSSQISLANPTKILGWGEHSIVKLYGNNAASAWPESYQADAVIGQRGQTGVTAVAYTDLTDANSNAICFINRTTSAALLYGDRVNSGAIGYLTKFARANSGGVVYLTLLARTSSNVLLVGNRTTSNALLYGDRVNSGGVGYLTKFARTTSNALLYGDRVNSSAVVYSGTGVRATSNAVNAFYNNLAVPTTDSIDGTQFMRYHTLHHVFHNNGNAWSIRGWVRFNDGFTVMPLASVIMDTLTTVSGGFDLRDTGTLILNNDLYLAHNVTLTNGGNIKGQASSTGQANTIFMGGDLTLASDSYAKTLHITGDWSSSGTSGDLIIDGCGHTLNIGDRAQIFVDQNVTLTLRNMTIKTGPKSLMVPPIRLAAHGSKLALDNVMFDLGTDFQFKQGQIFIHDEVAVTGTSAFVYQSPVPSYITSGATWSFEQGTTFSVAPSTFTDCPFTVNNTYTNNAFLVLADASAALSLNGCSFQTTFTGLRLRSGMVLFDNKVAIDTTAGVDLATTGTVSIGYFCGATTGNSPRSAAWSPDGRFLAVVCYVGNVVQVYRFNGSSAPTLLGSAATGIQPYSVSWSPDGRFLAVANLNTPRYLQVYRFKGSSTLTSLGTVSAGSALYVPAWSPDGRFLAVAVSGSNIVQVYRFNGSSTPVLLGTAATGTGPRSVAWSPDGRFLAVATYDSNTVQVYSFDGSNALSALGAAIVAGSHPYSVVWSLDGRFLAVVNISSNTLQVYRFNGSGALTLLGTAATGTTPYSVVWSPDGRFLAVASFGSFVTGLRVYSFNGTSAPTALATVPTGASPFSVSWSPDGQFVSVASFGKNAIQIFRCNYYYTGQPTQGFSNGLIFGDKAKGVAYDTDVQILGNATVSISGIVRDDSV